jgi:hypothetical protein
MEMLGEQVPTMSCPRCEELAKQESKQLAKCSEDRKRLEKLVWKLQLALTVLGTLAGKELLDQALSLTEKIPGIASSFQDKPATPGSSFALAPTDTPSRSYRYDATRSSILAYVPPLTPGLAIPEEVPGLFLATSLIDTPSFVPSPGVLPLLGLSVIQDRRRK